jgi:hypothetical protein
MKPLMKKEKSYIVGEFQLTGSNNMNIDLLINDWNYLWFLSQWNDEYRLIKYVRYDSPNTDFKSTISNEQAKELISKLGLVREQSIFASGSSWRRPSDESILEVKRSKKYKSKI